MAKRAKKNPVVQTEPVQTPPSPEVFYLPMRVSPWSSFEVPGLARSLSGPAGTVGIVLVYAKREDAEKQFPGADIAEMRVIK